MGGRLGGIVRPLVMAEDFEPLGELHAEPPVVVTGATGRGVAVSRWRRVLFDFGRRGLDIEPAADYCILRVFSGATVSPDRRECVSRNLNGAHGRVRFHRSLHIS